MHTRSIAGLLHATAARRRGLYLASLFCAALLILAAPNLAAAATPAPLQQAGDSSGAVSVADSSLGQILVDAGGMSLYMFDKDEPGKSNCYDQCAVRWPPLLVDAGATPTAGDGVSATLGVTERTDGTYQVTANDMPLYYWYEDKQPGDVLGQAVGDVWWVLGPDGSVIRTAAAATPEATAEATAEATVEASAEMTATAEATPEATAEATVEATAEASAASDTSAAGGTSDTSAAPQQLPVTGADGGTLGALIAAIGVLAGGGWVALRSRKH